MRQRGGNGESEGSRRRGEKGEEVVKGRGEKERGGRDCTMFHFVCALYLYLVDDCRVVLSHFHYPPTPPPPPASSTPYLPTLMFPPSHYNPPHLLVCPPTPLYPTPAFFRPLIYPNFLIFLTPSTLSYLLLPKFPPSPLVCSLHCLRFTCDSTSRNCKRV